MLSFPRMVVMAASGNLLINTYNLNAMTTLFDVFFLKECESEYCSGIFSDELDKLGYKDQVVPEWKLNNGRPRLFGKIRTISIEEIDTDDERIKDGLGFLSRLSRGEVMLVKGSSKFAYFGELMSRLSREVGI